MGPLYRIHGKNQIPGETLLGKTLQQVPWIMGYKKSKFLFETEILPCKI